MLDAKNGGKNTLKPYILFIETKSNNKYTLIDPIEMSVYTTLNCWRSGCFNFAGSTTSHSPYYRYTTSLSGSPLLFSLSQHTTNKTQREYTTHDPSLVLLPLSQFIVYRELLQSTVFWGEISTKYRFWSATV